MTRVIEMKKVILKYYIKALGLSFIPVFLAFWYASGFSNKEAQIGVFIAVVYGLLSAMLYSPIFLINSSIIQRTNVGRNICIFFHFIITTIGIGAWGLIYGFDKGILITGSIFIILDLLITLYTFIGIRHNMKNNTDKINCH